MLVESRVFHRGIVSIPRVLQLVCCCTLVVRTVSVRFHSELPEIALVLVTIYALPIHFIAGKQVFQTEDIFANNRRGVVSNICLAL